MLIDVLRLLLCGVGGGMISGGNRPFVSAEF